MTLAPHQTVLQQVRRDLEATQAEIDGCIRRQRELELQCVKLQAVATYLEDFVPDLTQQTAPSVEVELPDDQGGVGKSLTAEVIRQKAKEMLQSRGRGGFVRAIEVALALIPGYERDADARNFENRVYSIIKRSTDDFELAGKGQWTLRRGDGFHLESSPGKPAM